MDFSHFYEAHWKDRDTCYYYKILVKGILHTMGPLKFLSIFKNKSDLLLLLIDFALFYQGTGPDWEVGSGWRGGERTGGHRWRWASLKSDWPPLVPPHGPEVRLAACPVRQDMVSIFKYAYFSQLVAYSRLVAGVT